MREKLRYLARIGARQFAIERGRLEVRMERVVLQPRGEVAPVFAGTRLGGGVGCGELATLLFEAGRSRMR
jgi:hypothetical protein